MYNRKLIKKLVAYQVHFRHKSDKCPVPVAKCFACSVTHCRMDISHGLISGNSLKTTIVVYVGNSSGCLEYRAFQAIVHASWLTTKRNRLQGVHKSTKEGTIIGCNLCNWDKSGMNTLRKLAERDSIWKSKRGTSTNLLNLVFIFTFTSQPNKIKYPLQQKQEINKKF